MSNNQIRLKYRGVCLLKVLFVVRDRSVEINEKTISKIEYDVCCA